MKRLLIDASSVVKAALYAAAKGEHARLIEFEGKQEVIPSHVDGYEIWLTSLKKTLDFLSMVPCQVILVKDGRNASEKRREFLPGYRERPARPPEFFEEYSQMMAKVERNLLSYGAIVVDKEGVEADDMIAALAQVLHHVIWSTDKDLLAAGTVYMNGDLDPGKFLGIAKNHIVVYKSLIGDQSDKIPGAKGFGEKAFIDMVAKYGDECLDELLEMLGNRTLHELQPYAADFKPFQKIIDNAETIYASYDCARFHHPGWYDINWKMEYPKGDGTWPQWDLKIELITKDRLTPEFILRFRKQLEQVPWGPSFDIETWSDEESLAWGIANKSQRGPRLDVYGAHMAGFSITTGPNNNIVCYFPVDHKDTRNISLVDMKLLLDQLQEDRPLFVWNQEFELPVVRKHLELRFDRGWLPNVHDALIMKSYVDENTPLKLKSTTKTYLGYNQVTFEEVTSGGSSRSWEAEEDENGAEEEDLDDDYTPPSRQMNELTGLEVVGYGADDSICTGALASLFEVIMKYEGTWDAFSACETLPGYLCAEAFLTGQKFDLTRLEGLTKENAKKQSELWEKVNERLVTLEWTEYNGVTNRTEVRWIPGCRFDPIVDLSPAELKRGYKQVTGEALKSNMRSPEKLAVLMMGKAPDLARALTDGATPEEQLARFNEVGEKLFTPRPELNLGSPKQMCNLLYNAMKFPVRLRGKRTEKMKQRGELVGNPKGNELAIRHAIMHDADEWQKELLLLLIETKSLITDKSLYLKPYVNMPNPKSGLIHGSYGQSRQKTRRFSSSAPNRTQLSHKSPIREVYVPIFPDHVIVSFDEASQELRHAAVHSQDEAMLSCFLGENKRDIHSITGRAILEKQGKIITYEEFLRLKKADDKHIVIARKKAKEANFLDQYLGTAPTLSEKLLIPVEEGQSILDAKREAFPGLSIWQNKVVEECRETGYALTPLGARKHIPLDGSWQDEHHLRSALNSIIQGGAAEQIKMAMVRLWKMGITDLFDCIFLFPCHDELVFSCHIDQVVEFCRTVHAVMTQPYGGLNMPWESSIEIGWNYGQMREFENFDAAGISEYVEELKHLSTGEYPGHSLGPQRGVLSQKGR